MALEECVQAQRLAGGADALDKDSAAVLDDEALASRRYVYAGRRTAPIVNALPEYVRACTVPPSRAEVINLLRGDPDTGRLNASQLEDIGLRGLAFPELRGIFWRVHLNYLSDQPDAWPDVLRAKRAEYWNFTRMAGAVPADGEVRSGPGVAPFVDGSDECRRILNDVHRTCPQSAFFQDEASGARLRDAELQRILLTFSRLNTGIGYVQGMSELAGLLLYVLACETDAVRAALTADPADAELSALLGLFAKGEHEADTFWCFVELVSAVRDNFNREMDSSAVGVMADMAALNAQLRRADYTLWAHLEAQGVDHRFYSFRWVTLLLSQEFSLDQAVRLWDALLSDSARYTRRWLLYAFALAMLLELRDELLALEFNNIVPLLQAYPTQISVTTLMPLAIALRDGHYRPPDWAEREILHEGPLLLWVAASAQWLPHHMVLVRSRSGAVPLRLIKCADDAAQTELNAIALSPTCTVADAPALLPTPREGPVAAEAFTLAQGGRKYLLAAPSRDAKWAWMACLSRAVGERVVSRTPEPLDANSDAAPHTPTSDAAASASPVGARVGADIGLAAIDDDDDDRATAAASASASALLAEEVASEADSAEVARAQRALTPSTPPRRADAAGASSAGRRRIVTDADFRRSLEQAKR